MITAPWVASAELDALRARINVRPDVQLTEDYLNIEKRSVSAGLTFYLQDGRVLDEVLSEYPPSHVLKFSNGNIGKEEIR